MKIVGLMPVRNEDWCLGLTARAALLWCDELVMLDHASTDGTREIIDGLEREYPGRIVLQETGDGEWREMDHRQSLLMGARSRGASHTAIVDADELLTGNLVPRMRDIVAMVPPQYLLQLPGYNTRGALERYHSTGIWGNRWFTVAFMDSPRARWQGDEFHHREPVGIPGMPFRPIVHGQGGVLHLWGASEERLVAKHALYKCVERVKWPAKPVAYIDKYYNYAVYENASLNFGRWEFEDVPTSWLEPYKPLLKHLHRDAKPWQTTEVKRLVEQHGRQYFAGMDLFGVA